MSYQVCKPGKLKITLAIAYSLMILISSVIPMDQGIDSTIWVLSFTPEIQNLLHIPVFTILTILWLQILKDFGIPPIKRILIALVTAIGFGILNEIIQGFIPGRYPAAMDIAFNSFGVFGGILVFYFSERMRPGFIRRVVCG